MSDRRYQGHEQQYAGGGAVAPPANPQFFVASTGNDGNGGSSAAPLATVSEALRRLTVSGWSGQPVVTVVDSINEGASPKWQFPPTPSGAFPILVQGTTTTVLPATAPTGGTTGAQFGTATLPTITSAAPGGANVYREKFLRFTAGPLANIRTSVNSNNGAGGFVLTGGQLAAAPVAADLFVIEDVPAITWTGNFFIGATDYALLDSLQLSYPANGNLISMCGLVQVTALRHIGGAGTCSFTVASGIWQEVGIGFFVNPPTIPLPFGVHPCGSIYDGSAGAFQIGGASPTNGQKGFGTLIHVAMMARLNVDWICDSTHPATLNMWGLCALDTCGIDWFVGFIGLFSVVLTNCRKTPGTSAHAVVTINYCTAIMANLNFTGTQANSDLLEVIQTKLQLLNFTGANPNAGITPLLASKGSSVELVLGAPTASGTVVGNDCIVGANAVNNWANVFGGLAANSTDLAAASPQLCRVGP